MDCRIKSGNDDRESLSVAQMIQFETTIPILRIFSEEKARDFYLGYLGFSVDWEHRFEPGMPLYMQVARAGLTLHLSEHHGDGTPGSIVYVRMRGIDALHAELIAKEYKFLRPGVEDREWKARELTVSDPFQNQIRFSEAR